jgi:hypothetical protein
MKILKKKIPEKNPEKKCPGYPNGKEAEKTFNAGLGI